MTTREKALACGGERRLGKLKVTPTESTETRGGVCPSYSAETHASCEIVRGTAGHWLGEACANPSNT